MRRTLRSLLLLVLTAPAVSSAQVTGLDPDRDIGQYSHRAWTKRDGLPQNSVLSIAQTPDGYLWFGTMEGLVRFDGTSFSTLNTRNTPQLGSNYVLCLLVDHSGTLWVGTNGAGLLRLRNGEIKHAIEPTDQEHPIVLELKEGRNGDVWAATTVGLAQIRGDSLLHLYGMADGLPTMSVHSIAEDQQGRILAATGKGIWIHQDGCFEPFIIRLPSEASKKTHQDPTPTIVDGTYAMRAVATRLLVDREGSLWMGTSQDGLILMKHNAFQTYTTKDGLGHGSITALMEDQRGTVWVGTKVGGLSRVVNTSVSTFTSAEGLSGDDVSSLFEDREGVLWVGVVTGGVNRFINSKFTTFRTGSTAFANMVWGVFVDPPDRVMASTVTGDLLEYRHGAFVPTSLARGVKPPEDVCYAFLADRSGVRWIGTSMGVLRLSGGEVRSFPISWTASLCEDRYGRVWAGTDDGLWCFVGGKFQWVKSGSGGAKPKGRVREVAIDRAGNLWVAYRTDGIARFRLPSPTLSVPVLDLKTAVHFTRKEGLLSEWITAMTMDSSGALWVAPGTGGLNVIRKDTVFTLTSGQGLPDEMLMGIVEDGRGFIWLTSNNGVCRINIAQLFEYFGGRTSSVSVQTFGMSDGMYSDEFNGGYSACVARTPDGKLWLPSIFGVVMVDPAHLPTNTVPPALVLERVRIDNREGLLRSNAEYPPGNGELEFHFVGISSNAPERIQFQYMLEGFNKEWIDAGTRREAFYTNIPPGSYRFRVIASNADGVWNETGVAYPFVLQPRFTQTVWFGVLVALLLISFVTGIWYFYKRDRDRELQGSQLESKLAQAQLQILEMQLQPHFLFNTLNGIMVLIKHDPEMASRMIARLSEFLRLTLESAGEQEVTLRRELEYLNRYIQIEQLRFGDRLTVEQAVHPSDLDAMVPNLILQPLVENAIRHGVSKRRGPAVIRVEAVRENGSLTIHVRDNGEGLKSSTAGGVKEGIGLTNTRARLQFLYGAAQRCDLTSPPEGGVDVALTIPYHMQRVA
jgi:ligand-binding sensor domain-containing protein/two-component sensor histidine kinase